MTVHQLHQVEKLEAWQAIVLDGDEKDQFETLRARFTKELPLTDFAIWVRANAESTEDGHIVIRKFTLVWMLYIEYCIFKEVRPITRDQLLRKWKNIGGISKRERVKVGDRTLKRTVYKLKI